MLAEVGRQCCAGWAGGKVHPPQNQESREVSRGFLKVWWSAGLSAAAGEEPNQAEPDKSAGAGLRNLVQNDPLEDGVVVCTRKWGVVRVAGERFAAYDDLSSLAAVSGEVAGVGEAVVALQVPSPPSERSHRRPDTVDLDEAAVAIGTFVEEKLEVVLVLGDKPVIPTLTVCPEPASAQRMSCMISLRFAGAAPGEGGPPAPPDQLSIWFTNPVVTVSHCLRRCLHR